MSEKKKTNVNISFQEIEEVKEYLETIIALMPGHVYWKDQNGVLLGCNDQQAKSAGLVSRKEIVGKTDYDMPWKEQADSLRKIDQEVIRTGKPKTIEERSTLANGTESIFLSKKVPHYYKGRVVGIVGISFDITEQKRTEKELWELNHRLDNIINSIPGHVYWKDRNGVLLGCNDEQAKDIGLTSRHDIIGLTAYDMLPKEQAEAVIRNDAEVMKKGVVKTLEETLTLPNGKQSIWLSRKVPLYNNKGEVVGLLGISIDITEVKRTKKKLQEVKHRVEGMTVVSGSIAHELRTPLAALNLKVENLEESLPALLRGYQLAKEANLSVPVVAQEHLQYLENLPNSMEFEIRSAFTFIDILLTNLQSTVSTGTGELFSIASCVEEALSRYPFQTGQRELIHADLAEDFKVNGKTTLIVHVLFNLIKNALYYIAAAGKGEILISLKRDQRYNKLYFKDTGTGIPKSVLPKIFHRFFSKTYHGAGIGLTYCKMVMKALGGNITCESTEGKYTLFTLTFPVQNK